MFVIRFCDVFAVFTRILYYSRITVWRYNPNRGDVVGDRGAVRMMFFNDLSVFKDTRKSTVKSAITIKTWTILAYVHEYIAREISNDFVRPQIEFNISV